MAKSKRNQRHKRPPPKGRKLPKKERVARSKEFGHWEKATVPEDRAEKMAKLGKPPDQVWINNLYQVVIYFNVISEESGWAQMHWLSIKRLDKDWVHDWRHLQRIKNDLIGPEHEGVEMYPAESRLVDTANQYHLFVLAQPHVHFPFGYGNRLVGEGGKFKTTVGKGDQRPFEPDAIPDDTLSHTEHQRHVDEVLGEDEP